MSHVDHILEQVGWITARRDMAEALHGHDLDLTSDWLDVLTRVAITIADRGRLPFESVAEGVALAARHWWPEA